MRPPPALLFILISALLAACGATEEDSSGDNNQPRGGGDVYDGGGEGGDEIYEPDPPSGTATFDVNHDSGQLDLPPGNIAKGFASAQTTEAVMTELAETGSAGGLFRHDLRVNSPLGEVPTALLEGKKIGMDTWVTVMGTPLNMSPSTEGEEYESGLPPYARWTPTNVDLWADTIVDQLERYESAHGFVPDYVEIWNEPDRVEFYSGDIDSYLSIYSAASQKVKNRWPGTKVGGMGLAGHSSSMGGDQSAILSLIDHAAANSLPLDFVSWHHYTIANELKYSGFIDDVRERLAIFNMSDVKLVVSEWNIYPSTNGHGPEFDGSHSAANYAGFQTTARELGLDGNIMFLLQDVGTAVAGIDDFTGQGMGAITAHGIKKPVFHVIETMQKMADEPMLDITRPDGELSVNLYATKVGDRVRYVVSNDVVLGDWVWAHRLRDAGMLPGELWPLYVEATRLGGPESQKPTESQLLLAGMTSDEAAAVKSFEDELNLAWEYATENRPVEITFNGELLPTITNVYRFDSKHNNFAQHIDEIMPYLEQADEDGRLLALDVASDFFFQNGIIVSAEELGMSEDMEQWIAENNIPDDIASEAFTVYRKQISEGKLINREFLNSLPQMSLNTMSAAEAELIVTNQSISFTMEPDSVLIFDVYL